MGKTIRIRSAPMIHAPGLFRYAQVGYQTSKGRGRTPFINIFAKGYGLPRKVAIDALSGKIPHRFVGDTVILEVEGDKKI